VPQSVVFPLERDWSDVELGSIPCAYGTAENMLHRAGVRAGEHVLVTGASGGVGSAAVQLAKRRGAEVTAVCSASKVEAVGRLGPDRVVARDAAGRLDPDSIDVAVDNVVGPGFGTVLDSLRRGGRYVTSGAVAGPLVDLDVRTLYLRDLTLIGCTAWDEPAFPAVVAAIERGEIEPIVAQTFALADIAEAQRLFLERRHVGKIVLIPPGP
jgi:NADPH:quinone reductase-like Zn-dependent oxidoreductase